MIAMFILLATLAVDGSTASSAELADICLRAEEAYHAGLEARADAKIARPLFRQAAADYERLWQLGVRNPLVARNMAQAHFLAGDLGRSIRAYHLGLRLAPHDKDLHSGLSFAREKVSYPVAGNLAESCQPRDQSSMLRIASADVFRCIAAGLYLFAFLAFARAWMTRRPIWWTFGGLLIASAGVVMGGLVREEMHRIDDNRLSLVVVEANDTPLRRGNSAEYPLRLGDRLPAGVELRVLSERGGWLQVQLAGGEIGWLERERVVTVKTKGM